MRRQRTALRELVTTLLLAMLATPALTRAADGDVPAERDATVLQLSSEGSRHYKNRDYRRAVEKFIQAYAIDRDPNLLFNIARCYEKLGDPGAAMEKYEEFLSTPGADAQGQKRAHDSLALLAQQRGAPAARDEAARDARGEPAPPASKRDVTVSPRTPSASGVVPWLALGTGVASAGFGAIVYALGASDHATVTDAAGYGEPNAVDSMTESEAQSLVDSGDTKKLIGGIGMGVGGALVATSIVLFVTGFGASESVAVGVAPARAGGSIAITGRF